MGFQQGRHVLDEVLVPHSYNAQDGHSSSYFRGKGTYTCNFRLGNTRNASFLIFKEAAQATMVKVNNVQIASHKLEPDSTAGEMFVRIRIVSSFGIQHRNGIRQRFIRIVMVADNKINVK